MYLFCLQILSVFAQIRFIPLFVLCLHFCFFTLQAVYPLWWSLWLCLTNSMCQMINLNKMIRERRVSTAYFFAIVDFEEWLEEQGVRVSDAELNVFRYWAREYWDEGCNLCVLYRRRWRYIRWGFGFIWSNVKILEPWGFCLRMNSLSFEHSSIF